MWHPGLGTSSRLSWTSPRRVHAQPGQRPCCGERLQGSREAPGRLQREAPGRRLETLSRCSAHVTRDCGGGNGCLDTSVQPRKNKKLCEQGCFEEFRKLSADMSQSCPVLPGSAVTWSGWPCLARMPLNSASPAQTWTDCSGKVAETASRIAPTCHPSSGTSTDFASAGSALQRLAE